MFFAIAIVLGIVLGILVGALNLSMTIIYIVGLLYNIYVAYDAYKLAQ